MHAKRLLACLLAFAALFGAACGGDDDDASPVTVDPAGETTTTSSKPTTTTEPTPTTIDPADPLADVQQAFYDMWDTFVDVGARPDPQDPRIAQRFTGDARLSFMDALVRLVRNGQALREPDDPSSFRPTINTVKLVSETEADVYECTIDGLVVFDVDTGESVDDDVSKVANRNRFVLEDGSWKVSQFSDLSPEDPQCDF